MARITFEGNFCDISMCRENPCPYNGMCSQRQTWERLKEYEDTGFDPEEIADFMKRWEQTVEIGGMLKKYCIDHIRDLLHAEQDGRLVVLPCKVGDTVYWLHNDVITECRVHRVQMNRTGLFICLKSKVSHGAFRVDICLGKTVFLTREEAEAALKGGDSPENRTDRR